MEGQPCQVFTCLPLGVGDEHMSTCTEALESRGGSEREEGKAELGTHCAARIQPAPLLGHPLNSC